MPNQTLVRASRSPRVRSAVTALPPSKALARRFVAGDDAASALDAVRTLAGRGLLATVDLLGEDVHDLAQAQATTAAYEQLLADLGRAGLAARAEVSVKLSALGQALGAEGPRRSTEHLARICAAADAVGTTVTVDMEDHTTVDATLATVTELRDGYPWLGAVLQSALLRTPGDCRDLTGPGSRVRLVKGAYAEPASVAHAAKADVDAAYVECLQILMAGQGRPMVATHDPAMLEMARVAAAAHGRTAADWEVQMLLGVRPGLQTELASSGTTVRIYLPYGQDWFGYFMRRLAERPANIAFLLRSLVSR